MGLAAKKIESQIQDFFQKEPRIKYVGFSNNEDRHQIEVLADKMLSLSPSDALLSFELVKESNQFLGKCYIKSSSLNIEIEAYGESPLKTMQNLTKNTRQELDKWKRKRWFI